MTGSVCASQGAKHADEDRKRKQRPADDEIGPSFMRI